MIPKTRLSVLSSLFFLSGFSALTVELVFVKYLGYVFGTTAHAVSTVLAAFMAGLSLGNVLGGRYSERITRRLRWYGSLELGVGVFAILSPLLFRGLGVFVGWIGSSLADTDHGILWLTLLRFVLASLVVLPPTVAMGISFPLLVRTIRDLPNLEGNIGRLYTINTFGAAMGTLACTYVVIAACGLLGTLCLVLALNSVVFVGCWLLDRDHESTRTTDVGVLPTALDVIVSERTELRMEESTRTTDVGVLPTALDVIVSERTELRVEENTRTTDIGVPPMATDVIVSERTDLREEGVTATVHAASPAHDVTATDQPEAIAASAARAEDPVASEPRDLAAPYDVESAIDPFTRRWVSPGVIYSVAAVSGFVTLAFEVLWSHLLATVVGTSTYAFGLVLAIFLVALTIGGALVSRFVDRLPTRSVALILGLGLLATGGSIAYSMSNWERAGAIFDLVGYFKPSFLGRELTRAAVVVWLIFLPALAMGVLFPTALCLQRMGRAGSSRRVGVTYAVNTAGTIAGSTVTGFWLIEWLGSQGTMRLLGGFVALLAFPLLLVAERRIVRYAALASGFMCCGCFVWSTPWDIARMTSGSNVYFAPGFDRSRHKLVHFAEDVHGGMTTVVNDHSEYTLMTNGKFEGNNGPERLDQILVAAIPNLYVKHRARALNIGIGTGQTASVLHAFGYHNLDAVDISPNIVSAARRWFKDVHHGVFDEKNVHVRIRDGRNHLLLTPYQYDLISIELTSIWFASAGNLYSREFYELCKQRMTDDGVLQQWVQLHHIELEDIATIMTTMKTVFPDVELWLGGHQGILVAGRQLPTPNPEALRAASAYGRELLELAGLEDPKSILSHRLVPKEKMDTVLHAIVRQTGRLSTDNSVVLEYSTPRGNALDRAEEANLTAIRAML